MTTTRERIQARRARVLAKSNACCGYCGTPLDGHQWHMDHVDPLQRGRDDIGGSDSESNLMAACSRCNLWKKTFSVDQFRSEIEAQRDRLYRDSAAYRLAWDHGAVTSTGSDVVFYFETLEPS